MPDTQPQDRQERLTEALRHVFYAVTALDLMDLASLRTLHPAADWDGILRLDARARTRASDMMQVIGRWLGGEYVESSEPTPQPWYAAMDAHAWVIVAAGSLRDARELTHVNDGEFGDYAALLDAIDATEELVERISALMRG